MIDLPHAKSLNLAKLLDVPLKLAMTTELVQLDLEQDRHDVALKTLGRFFARVLDVADVLAAWKVSGD